MVSYCLLKRLVCPVSLSVYINLIVAWKKPPACLVRLLGKVSKMLRFLSDIVSFIGNVSGNVFSKQFSADRRRIVFPLNNAQQ